MLEHKQFQNTAFTGSNSYWCFSKSIDNQLDEQTVVFIVAVNQDKYKKESSTSTSTSTSTLFHKTIGYNRLARKIAIANLGEPVK